MISLIICSRKGRIAGELEKNIATTIGVEYETIVINNSTNTYSIFEAYNIGVAQAKYPYLCFMHEDILYHSNDWGKQLIRNLENEKVGIVGIIGGHLFPNEGGSWWSSCYISGSIIQGNTINGIYNAELQENKYYAGDKAIEVAVVDGVWFGARKTLFSQISFDANYFKGFHAYDADICLQAINKGYQVSVIPSVLIEHTSLGTLNMLWFDEIKRLQEKWSHILPLVKGIAISEKEKNDRLYLISQIFNLNRSLLVVKNSKAYKIGKFILKPLSLLKK